MAADLLSMLRSIHSNIVFPVLQPEPVPVLWTQMPVQADQWPEERHSIRIGVSYGSSNAITTPRRRYVRSWSFCRLQRPARA